MTNPHAPPISARTGDVAGSGPAAGSPSGPDGRTEPERATSASDAGDGDYRSPESPEDDHWLALGIKVAGAMLFGDLVARLCGFDSPTWSVITAALLATSPPFASARAALKRLFALAVGVALGAGGAYAAQLLSGVPSLHFVLVGLIVGALGTRSEEYLFAAVVGTVITFVGSAGGDPLPEVVTTTACMVLIGCVVGPSVVWCVERARRAWAERGA